jgi:hypothetical protein
MKDKRTMRRTNKGIRALLIAMGELLGNLRLVLVSSKHQHLSASGLRSVAQT